MSGESKIYSVRTYLIYIFSVLFLVNPLASMAKDFCVQNQEELIRALTSAATNGEDDVLHIVNGTLLEDFRLPSEPGQLIKIMGGYSAGCIDRVVAPEVPAASSETTVEHQGIVVPQQNTTGPTPPPEVEPKADTFSGGAMSGGIDITVLGVPGYAWRHGCGPTAVGMVAGYWDEKGCSDLFDGSAATQTTEVNQGIASQGSASSPRHYEDYSLPIDYYPDLLEDKSEAPAGDEHTSDSIADFMLTSWSSVSNRYGWSWSSDITPAFHNYAVLRNSSYVPSTSSYYFGSSLTWNVLTSEIDAQRPMVFLVDSSGNGSTDHFVTVVGYRIEGSTQYYGCLDTWSPYDTIRWVQFRGMSSSYSWGIWGGYSFQLTCPLKGDIDHSTNIDLTDAILGLQIVSGIAPSVTIFTDSDVNVDSKIGIEEVLFILQDLAE